MDRRTKRYVWYFVALVVVLIGLALYFNQVVPTAEDVGAKGLEKAGDAADFVKDKMPEKDKWCYSFNVEGPQSDCREQPSETIGEKCFDTQQECELDKEQ